MDELEKRLVYTVDREINGVNQSWTFRRPTSGKLIQVDVLAARLRGNTPVNALIYAVGISDAVAYLSTTIIEPKVFDFGTLYDDDVTSIYDEVVEWMKSFRRPVQEAKGKVGEGL